VEKTVCLSDKLAQIQVAKKSMQERTAALKSAVARGDTDLANHELSVLGVLRQRGESLAADAEACVGEPIIRPGHGDPPPIVWEDPNIARVDPGFGSSADVVVIVPPLPASGFK
jgi:hypothetical protein